MFVSLVVEFIDFSNNKTRKRQRSAKVLEGHKILRMEALGSYHLKAGDEAHGGKEIPAQSLGCNDDNKRTTRGE